MRPDEPPARTSMRVLHAARGHARHLPALALLELDAPAHGIGLPLLPLDLVAVVVACGDARRCHSFVVPLAGARHECRLAGRVELAIALLTPLGALRAFRVPPGRLPGPHPALSQATGLASTAVLHRLLARDAAPRWRLAAFTDWLEARMARHTPADAALRTAEAALRLLHAPHPAPKLDALSLHAGVTPRQLRRDFHHWLGLAPDDYRRRVRLQRSLGPVADGQPLAEVASANGHADQAHMTREFQAWTGLAPSRWAGTHRSPTMTAVHRALAGRVLLPPGAFAEGTPP